VKFGEAHLSLNFCNFKIKYLETSDCVKDLGRFPPPPPGRARVGKPPAGLWQGTQNKLDKVMSGKVYLSSYYKDCHNV